MRVPWLVVTLFLLVACGNAAEPTPTPSSGVLASPTAAPITPTPARPGVLARRTTPADAAALLPALVTRTAQVQTALAQAIPILLLDDGLDEEQRLAQELAIQDRRFQADLRSLSGEPLRNEIFGIYPTRASDHVGPAAACAQSKCYRVEMYNYGYNLTTTATVDVARRTVLAVNLFPDTQPDIPPALTQLAIEIAINAPEVQQALGVKPDATAALMANTKTALNRSRCERSRHLCVAPTFVQGYHALWAIVDLTDGVLVGLRWTNLGAATTPPLTEQTLQNEVVTDRFCTQTTPLAQDGWEMAYILTSSDGLRLSDVRFRGRPVLESVKLVDWHVSYSGTDAFGYSDAIGCPVFSQAAVVAFEGPQVEELRENGEVTGFELVQGFRSELWPQPCNYYYEQRYQFYQDGRFRVVAANLGRGCGAPGTYRPVLRIVPAGAYTISAWDGADWQTWATERWAAQGETPFTTDGYQYRLLDGNGQGYYLAPGQGQFADRGRGDNAYLYAIRRHPDRDEGESDLVTIGPCCNDDHQQGPEKFIDSPPEPIVGSELVLWYVAQIENDNTPGREYCWADYRVEAGVFTPQAWPCYSGPLFVPVNGESIDLEQ